MLKKKTTYKELNDEIGRIENEFPCYKINEYSTSKLLAILAKTIKHSEQIAFRKTLIFYQQRTENKQQRIAVCFKNFKNHYCQKLAEYLYISKPVRILGNMPFNFLPFSVKNPDFLIVEFNLKASELN